MHELKASASASQVLLSLTQGQYTADTAHQPELVYIHLMRSVWELLYRPMQVVNGHVLSNQECHTSIKITAITCSLWHQQQHAEQLRLVWHAAHHHAHSPQERRRLSPGSLWPDELLKCREGLTLRPGVVRVG